MQGDVNKVILVGRVVRGPAIRTTKTGVPQAVFTLSTTEVWIDKPSNEKRSKTVHHKIVVYGVLVGVVEKCVYVGGRLYLEGQLEIRRWTDKKDGAPTESWTCEVIIQGWSGRLTVLDFVDGPTRDKANAVVDGPDNSPHSDKIDPTNLPWLVV